MIVGIERSFPSRFQEIGMGSGGCSGGKRGKKLNRNFFTKNLPKKCLDLLIVSLNVTCLGSGEASVNTSKVDRIFLSAEEK